MQSASPIIRAEGLTRSFRVLDHRGGLIGALRNLVSRSGRVVSAVDRLSFTIREGEFVGMVGPNGAGKSTTLKMLTGVLVPTSGVAEVCGIEPYRDRQRNAGQIGVVFGQRSQLWWDLPPSDAFQLLAAIYRLPPQQWQTELERLTELLQLSDFLETPVRKLSLGQRMRCELVAALLHQPKVLYLDEPTIGLDLVAKSQLRDYLGQLNREQGTTVLLTSHDLSDIEALCRRVMIIDRGKLLHDGSIEDLRRCFGHRRRMTVEFAHEIDCRAPEACQILRSEDGQVELEFDAARWTSNQMLQEMLKQGQVEDFRTSDVGIEAVIEQIYSGRPM